MTDTHIVLTTMDLEAGTSTLTRSDGKEAVFVTGFTGDPDSRVARIQHSPPLNGVLITTKVGDEVVVPLGSPDGHLGIGDRPVVYLDQNQWSAVARVDGGEALANDEDDAAARRLLDWGKSSEVIFPLSGGHCVESTEWSNDDRRYRLGLTLMRMSAGWQVRHPLDVERDELTQSITRFLGHGGTSTPVFSTASEHYMAEGDRSTIIVGEDLPADYQQSLNALLHVSVTFDMLTDANAIPRQRMMAWREAQQRFSDHLDSLDESGHAKRKLILAFFVQDITHSIARVAAELELTHEQLSEWMQTRFESDLPDMPYLGLRHEFLVGKHLNMGAKWHDNDLVDMMFLCLGAAYADLVVCESSAASHIQQAQNRLGRTQTAVSKLRAGIGPLNERLESTAATTADTGDPA